jgi:hypothetical protein
VVSGILTALGAGASATLMVLADRQAGLMGDARERAQHHLDAGDGAGSVVAQADWQNAQTARNRLLISGGVAAGASGIGGALTISFHESGRRALAKLGDFEPEAPAPPERSGPRPKPQATSVADASGR